MDPMPGYITKKEAATYSSLKMRMLETLIREGKIRAFRIGRKTTLIEKASFDAFIEANEITPENRLKAKSEIQQLLNRAVDHARNMRARENKSPRSNGGINEKAKRYV